MTQAPPADPPPSRPRKRRQGQLGLIAASTSGLLVLAILYSLHAAQVFLLPVVIALFLAIVLNLPARQLRRLGLPAWAAAAVTVLSLMAVLVAGAWFLSTPAKDWLDRGPGVIRQLQFKLLPVIESLGGATELGKEIDKMTDDEGAEPEVQVAGPSFTEVFVDQASTITAGAIVVLVLLFFLLAGGRRMVAAVAITLPPEHRAVFDGIVRQVEVDIALYLQTITLINAGLGVVTGFAMWAAGMPSPALWGAMAAVLNFMPYLGAGMTLVVISAVSIITFTTPGAILLPPLLFLMLTTLEGQIVTPSIVGKRLTLNPLMVFLSVVAWGSLWGVLGALLAVPIMATIKIALDNSGRLKALRAAME